MIISTAVVARAAEDHRKEPHALEQQRGHAVPQVWCNSLFLAPQCGPGLFCFSDFYAAAVKMHVLSNQLMCCLRRSTATYSSAMMIPPFRLLQADYPSTILGIKYDNSTVIVLRDSADAFDNSDCTDALLQIRRYPLMILRIHFDNSMNKLQITHAVNLRIL